MRPSAADRPPRRGLGGVAWPGPQRGYEGRRALSAPALSMVRSGRGAVDNGAKLFEGVSRHEGIEPVRELGEVALLDRLHKVGWDRTVLDQAKHHEPHVGHLALFAALLP